MPIGSGRALTPPSSLLPPPGFSTPFWRGALVHVARAAVRADQFARLCHVEEHARMHVPYRGRGHGAVKRQVLLGDLDGALLLLRSGGHQRFPFLTGLAAAGLGLPVAPLDLLSTALDLLSATGASQSRWRSS